MLTYTLPGKAILKMPAPLTRPHTFDPPFPDLGCEHWPEPVPPEPYGFVADIDAALVQKILDISERLREPDIEHHGKADDLRAGLEVAEGGAFGHETTI